MALPLADDIAIYRGDDFARTYVLATGAPGSATPVNLTGCSIASQIRKTDTSVGTALATFDVTDRIDAEGRFTLRLSHSITSTLNVPEAVFDVQITTPAGIVTTYIRGSVEVISDVTRIGV